MLAHWTVELPVYPDISQYTDYQALFSSVYLKSILSGNVSRLLKVMGKTNHFVETRPLFIEDGSAGDLDALLPNRDVLFYMLTFLNPKDLASLCAVSRKMNFLASHDYVWRTLFVQSRKNAPRDMMEVFSWKQLYRRIHVWRWDHTTEKRSTAIDVIDDGNTAQRQQQLSSNPCIMTSKPFNRIKDSYEVEIKKRGLWIGVGLADNKLRLQNASTLGTQTQCVNSAFFCQDSTIIQMRCSMNETVQLQKKIEVGDKIKVKVDFDNNSINYYRNGTLEGTVISRVNIEEGTLYPALNLSYDSTVSLVNV